MQTTEKRKQSINDLAANYRPIGPRHLLAAALMLNAKKGQGEATKKASWKPVAA